MGKRKELLAAGIVKDYRFQNQSELNIYLYDLEYKQIQHQILEQITKQDGTVLARITVGYNNTPLIQLYNED